jgi:hypothetical protein
MACVAASAALMAGSPAHRIMFTLLAANSVAPRKGSAAPSRLRLYLQHRTDFGFRCELDAP